MIDFEVLPSPTVEPLPTVDLSETFYDPEVPFEEQAKKRDVQFKDNIK